MFKEKLYKVNYEKIIQYLFMMLGIILCIKKGGFFTSDCIIYMIGMILLGIIYFFNDINNIKKTYLNNKKLIYAISFLSLLSVAYSLPVIFHKTSYINDSVYEMIRYLTLVPVFLIAKDKNVNLIIIFALMQSILGIDGIANRYLKNILVYFNSGYLSRDLDRLSGTIQYANTTAIIILIGLIFVISKFKEAIKIKGLKKHISIYYAIINLFIISIILTKSRMVIILLLFSLFIIILRENKFIKISLCLNLFISFLASNNITNLINISKSNIYITVICYLCLSYIIIKNLIKYYDKIDFYNVFSKKKLINYKNILIVILLLLLTSYFYIDSDKIKLNNTTNISREIYNLEKDNIIEINYEIDNNSEFILKIIEEDKEFNKKEIYSNNIKNTVVDNYIKYNYFNENIDNIRRLIINIENKKGKSKINLIKINNKKLKLNYILLPSEFVFRLKNVFKGSSTVNDRIEYNKDAIKLWKRSKIIGLGGEAFRHNYKYVQDLKYNSTEVHNSFMQILLESGLIGFLCVVSIIIIALTNINKVNLYYKLSYFVFIFHSIFDLNFSYMISLVIFTILTKLIIQEKIQYKIDN